MRRWAAIGLCLGSLVGCEVASESGEAASVHAESPPADSGEEATVEPSAVSVPALQPTEGADDLDFAPGTWSAIDGASVDYVGVWSWEGAEFDPAAATWSFTNDLGIEFRLSGLWIVTGAVQLVPCEPAVSGDDKSDHVYTNDVSTIEALTLESAWETAPRYLGRATVSDTEYCDAHILSEPVPLVSAGGISNEGAAIVLAGDYRRSAAQPWRSLDASLVLGVGGLAELWVPAAAPEGRFTLELVRRPVWAFQTLEPDTISAAELAYEVLRGLLSSTEAWIRPD